MMSGKQRRLYHPRRASSLFGRIRWLYVGAACVVVLIMYMLLGTLMDTHGGQAYTRALCEQHEKLLLSGGLCKELCRDRSVHLSRFVEDVQGYRVFEGRDKLYKVRLSSLKELEMHPENGLQHVFAIPSEGTTIDDFRSMMYDMIARKLGAVNIKELLNKLLEMADVNKDGNISLGEAKTMWALMQHNEVFKLLLFSESEYVQKFSGHCGDVYAVEKIEQTFLYKKSTSSLVNFLFPNKHTWWLPSWNLRAKIVVGLLEFTLDAFQHGGLGSFYMCNVSSTSIGYTKRGDVKITQLNRILAREELGKILGGGSFGGGCRNSSDCAYTEHCTTTCDPRTKQCTADLLEPNLALICRIIKPYIIKGAPRLIMGDLLLTLDKCEHLEYSQQTFSLNHSLIINDLNLLLWKQISNKIL